MVAKGRLHRICARRGTQSGTQFGPCSDWHTPCSLPRRLQPQERPRLTRLLKRHARGPWFGPAAPFPYPPTVLTSVKFFTPLISRRLLLAATALVLSSCGGGGGGSSADVASPFVGNWYYADGDRYIVISADNAMTTRVCSSTGYRNAPELGHGTLSGDTLTVTSTFGTESGRLQRSGNSLLSLEEPSIALVLHPVVPSTCAGDYIEITAITPATAIEGLPTSFKVDFNYRLGSKDADTIWLLFNSQPGDPSGFTAPSDMPHVDIPRGTGTNTLTTTTMTPVLHAAPASMAAMVLMINTFAAQAVRPIAVTAAATAAMAPAQPSISPQQGAVAHRFHLFSR
jgi:hypothetical protein